MKDEKKEKCTDSRAASMVGVIWYIGWLFTIGFVKLTFWKAVLGLLIWPYFLGNALTIQHLVK